MILIFVLRLEDIERIDVVAVDAGRRIAGLSAVGKRPVGKLGAHIAGHRRIRHAVGKRNIARGLGKLRALFIRAVFEDQLVEARLVRHA